MYPIAICLLAIAAVIVHQAVAVVRSWSAGSFRHGVRRAILSRDLYGAITLCDVQRTPLARVLRAGIAVAHAPDEQVQLAIDAAYLKEVPRLWGSIRSRATRKPRSRIAMGDEILVPLACRAESPYGPLRSW